MSNLAKKSGHLVRTTASPYHLTTGCGAGDTGPAPCTCNWPTGLSTTYTVSGWSGLSPCASCDSSTDPTWTGTLYNSDPATSGNCIWWAVDNSADPFSISGVSLDIIYTQIVLNTHVSPCRWELYIACASLTHPSKNMWYGYKTTGSTPAGTYSFVGSDCGNTNPTMSVS